MSSKVPFGKNTEEARELISMFINKTIDFKCKPSDIIDMFATIKNGGFTAEKIRAGFNRARKEAEKYVNDTNSYGGKYRQTKING